MELDSLQKPFEHKGVWWMPEKPENRIFGTLKHEPVEGTTLELFGSFTEEREMANFQADIVLGELSSGGPITLFICHIKGYHWRMNLLAQATGFLEINLDVSVVLQGEHFASKDEIRFEKIDFGFSHLRNWADINRMDSDVSGRKLSAEYEAPDDIEVIVPEIGTIRLNMSARISSSITSVEIYKTGNFIVDCNVEKSIDAWWKIKYLLQVFLSFATGHAVHPLHMHRTRTVRVQPPYREAYDSYMRTELFFGLPEIPEDSSTEGPRNMLFIFADIADQWETCLCNWFEKSELLEPVYELYFGTLHQPKMYPVHKYASLAQALETYHRRTSNRSAFPKDDFKKRKTEILDAVPPEYKDWLAGKLNFANEISLHERLDEIVSTYESIFGSYAGRENLIKKVKDTRNYLTHYDPKSKQKAAVDADLYYLTQCLRVLLEMCLLRELGLNDDKVRAILQRKLEEANPFEQFV